MARSAYQRCKDRLVGLTIELDDRCKATDLLTTALVRERSAAVAESEALVTERREAHERSEAAAKSTLREVLYIPTKP